MPGVLDAHAKPPSAIRELYKTLQKIDAGALDCHDGVLDTVEVERRASIPASTGLPFELPGDTRQHFLDFLGNPPESATTLKGDLLSSTSCSPRAFAVGEVPGLVVYPALLPPVVQQSLLDKLVSRDLLDPTHRTNVHMHYHVSYPHESGKVSSFFDTDVATTFEPKTSEIHRPISVQQFLDKKLRWMTLGGQYDWTRKTYPAEPPPQLPKDIQSLIGGLFPMKAEAAIVNLYSPGDTLSLHRDVSEECNQPLASISLGCDCIFVAGLDSADEHGRPRMIALRLRSGDAVLMTGDSRYAWHGVPRILGGTCPEWLQDWPGEQHEKWRGWMRGKRINLNVRQMFD